MRIIFVIPQLTNGGAQREMAAYANKLVEMGEDVHIVSIDTINEDYIVDGRVQRHLFQYDGYSNTNKVKDVQPKARKRNKPFRKIRGKLSRLRKILKAVAMLRGLKPNVIIPIFPSPSLDAGIQLMAMFSKAKILFPVRNNLEKRYPEKKETHDWQIKSILADSIWVQVNEQRKFFPDYMQKKIFEVRNILDRSFLDISRVDREKVRSFISVGRINPQKNQKMLIRAFARMLERTGDQDATLTIYGSSKDYKKTEEELIDLISQYKLENRVFLAGRVIDIEAQYAKADAFILSSNYEGCPNALMEAMAAGLPCISTDCPTGPSAIIENNKNGLLVPVGDAEEMSRAMEYLIRNPQRANEFGRAAKERMKEWESTEELAEQLLTHLKRICETNTTSEKLYEAKQYWCIPRRVSFKIHNFVLPDGPFLKWRYKRDVGKKLHLRDPKNLTEKIQWLKLYNRRPEYTKLVDKYEVKKIMAERLGEEYVIPAIGIWDRFEDIDFTQLPEQFVLKCTHDSGSIVVCTDKSQFNIKAAGEKLSQYLKEKNYRRTREWVYKHVKPRIIAEPYIDSLGKPDSMEYKLTCFDGKVGFAAIYTGIAHEKKEERTVAHFDRDYNYIPFRTIGEYTKVIPEKPREWDELIRLSEKLSSGIPYVRVDWYIHHGKLYFGEMTFYPVAGFMKFDPPEYDRIWGDKLTLPKEKRRGR